MLLGLVIFCLATVPWAQGQKVHEQMSPDQVAEIFQSTHDSVPEYEVVQFHVPRVRKRDSEGLFMENLIATVFGDDVRLWLKPAEGVLAGKSTPVHLAKVDPANGTVFYKEIPAAMENVGILLEDPIQRASLVQRTTGQGQYAYDGFIGAHNLVVKSLPESISENLTSKNSSHDSESAEQSKTAFHIVYRKELNDFYKILQAIEANDERKATGESSSFESKMHAIPDVVYPEILVVVDHELFKTHKYSIKDTLMYVLAFWNGVDLLYRSFEDPKFRFNIARVVIATEENATPFIADNMYHPKLINAFKAYYAGQKYFYSTLNIFPANSYDAIVAMTGFQMTDGNGRPNTLGIALNSGACTVDHTHKTYGSFAISIDDGTFHGVATTAHEFAHLLGSSHDSGDDCGAEDGYIMAPNAGVTENAHDFSVCTVAAISKFLRRNGGWCFYNEPVVKDPLPRGLLPGLLSDRDHQCRTMGNGGSCYAGEPWQLACSAVYCYPADTPSICRQYKSQAPPDGAQCGGGKKCLHGKCLVL